MDEPVPSGRAGTSAHSDPEGNAARRRGLELLIGSNSFRDTNGVVKIQGKEQLVLEARPEEGLLLVTMDLYHENGIHIAHLRRNVFVVNRSGQFAVEVHRSEHAIQDDPAWVRLLDRQSGAPVFEARMTSEHRVHIEVGHFYSHRGSPVDITPNYCRIGSRTTLFGEIVESRGGMAQLGSDPTPRPFQARP
jgi:hypothetical protein